MARRSHIAILAGTLFAGCGSTTVPPAPGPDAATMLDGLATEYDGAPEVAAYEEDAAEAAPDLGDAQNIGDAPDESAATADASEDVDAAAALTPCGAAVCSVRQVCVTDTGGPVPPDGASAPVPHCVDWPATCATSARDCSCQALCGITAVCIHNGDGSFVCGHA